MEPHREPIKEWWENWETVGTRLRKFVSDIKHTTCWEVGNQDLNLKKKVMKVGTSTAGKVKSSCLRINETKTELCGEVSLIWKLHISYSLVGTLVLLGTQAGNLDVTDLWHCLLFLLFTVILQSAPFPFQFSSVDQSCLTLCDPMNCSMPGLPVHHQLPEFTQTHIHRFSDAIQPSHPLSSPSPPAPSPSQHQGLFQ